MPNRSRLAVAAFSIALLFFLWALLVLHWGGVRFDLFGTMVSSRRIVRPLLIAILLTVISLALDRRAVLSTFAPRSLRGLSQRMRSEGEYAFVVSVGLAVAIFVFALTLGSRAAGGADAYGYLSQARLWASGALIQRPPMAPSSLPWPDAAETLVPLGYRPTPDGTGQVPTYPPGFPILMAVFSDLLGACSVYLVVPLAGAAIVLLAYVLALRHSSPIVAMGTAAMTASSPVLLYSVLWPMSDVPAAAFWLAALVAASGSVGRPVLAGVLTGIAILIRPNLLPLSIVPALLVAVISRDRTAPTAAGALLRFACGCVPFVAAIALINNHLYGSAVRFGYGSPASLYALTNIVPNARRYALWLWESQSILVFAAIIAPVAYLLRRAPVPLLLVCFVALLIGSYLPYIVFDDWWYLRFLLPGLPLVFFFVVEGLWIASGPLGSTGRRVVTGLIAIAVAYYGLAFALRKEVTVIGEGEQRHVDIGYFAGTKLPGNAVVLALLHGGSVRYYSGRPIVRYDMLAPESLGAAVAALESLNYSPFLILDGGEEPEFRRRFRDQPLAQQLDDRLIATHDSRVPIRVYDLQSTWAPSSAAPARVPHVPRLQCLDRPARLSSSAAAPPDRSATRGGPASAWRASR